MRGFEGGGGSNDSQEALLYFVHVHMKHLKLNVTKKVIVPPNGTNVFCFLSSLPLLPRATTTVFGSYLSSLLLANTVSSVRACLSI